MQVVNESGSPGIAENPIEFYKTFCLPFGDFMVNSFDEAYDNKKMSSSQRQAIISLIEKKRKDRNYLERMGGQCRLKYSIQSYCS